MDFATRPKEIRQAGMCGEDKNLRRQKISFSRFTSNISMKSYLQ